MGLTCYRTMVSPEMASREKKWWYDERYAIYDLNVNSATVYPQHDETIEFPSSPSRSTYNVRGYAYGGGGRRINRVEVSLDKGSSEFYSWITFPRSFRITDDSFSMEFGRYRLP